MQATQNVVWHFKSRHAMLHVLPLLDVVKQATILALYLALQQRSKAMHFISESSLNNIEMDIINIKLTKF